MQTFVDSHEESEAYYRPVRILCYMNWLELFNHIEKKEVYY